MIIDQKIMFSIDIITIRNTNKYGDTKRFHNIGS